MGNHTVVEISRVRDYLFLGMDFRNYLRSQITPFNFVAFLMLLVGIPVMIYRLVYGIGASTNLTDTNPWGIWIGFDVMTGVALAAGGFVIGTAVHLFGMKEYRPFVRPAILTGFLGYLFAVLGLMFDLGRYYRLPYPMFVSLGVNSILFLVAWHVALYLTCQFVEWCPAIFESFNMKKLRRWFINLTIGATIFGVILSTLHQSALGSLFLLMPSKVHPLWYSDYIPVLFFISAIAAGISMVIIESALSHKAFKDQITRTELTRGRFDRLTLGLGKALAVLLFTYVVLKLVEVAHGNNWSWLFSGYGVWWMVEVFGFFFVPALLAVYGINHERAGFVRFAAALVVVGITLNRLNLSVICFNWDKPEVYYPNWMEIVVTLTIIMMGILTFRWIVNRMPILYDDPNYEAH